MPDPIQSSNSTCRFTPVEVQGASIEENNGQVCLISAHSREATPATPSAPAAPASPAVNQLVARFVKPTGVHPPVEPSLAHALGNCKMATASYLVASATTIAAAPETGGLSFWLGAAKIATTGAALIHCIESDETAQVEAGIRAYQNADCQAMGGVALAAGDGSALCAVPQ